MRNGHTEFIADILNKYIPKETIMIENADDLICSHIAENNKKNIFWNRQIRYRQQKILKTEQGTLWCAQNVIQN